MLLEILWRCLKNLGLIGAFLAGLGISPSMWRAGFLVLGEMAIWGSETLPKELGICMGIQQAYRNLAMNLDSLKCIGIWIAYKRWEERASLAFETREKKGKVVVAHQRMAPELGRRRENCWRIPEEIARGDWESESQSRKVAQVSSSGEESLF
jgi:hypothetical protein